MLNACRTVIMMVNTTGPNSSMVEKMNNCPIDEQMEVAKTCMANWWCRPMKAKQSSKLPLIINEVNVKIVEIKLTKNIILRNEIEKRSKTCFW